ncbi:MAG: carboxypeptidase-like regulatory domain-containing protein [Haliscomenobacter sp.]|nr:carboxypeptidase-like regulatory domain-containing protein [Haliscomenobacter sp.]
MAQDRTLLFQGNVLDSLSKEALVFVNIRIVGSTLGTSTNLDGRFQLLVKSGDQIRSATWATKTKIVISAETFGMK